VRGLRAVSGPGLPGGWALSKTQRPSPRRRPKEAPTPSSHNKTFPTPDPRCASQKASSLLATSPGSSVPKIECVKAGLSVRTSFISVERSPVLPYQNDELDPPSTTVPTRSPEREPLLPSQIPGRFSVSERATRTSSPTLRTHKT
jgi:hypothetical protein